MNFPSGTVAGGAYVGVSAGTPPNLTIRTFDPTPFNYQNFALGDQWLNKITRSLFYCASLADPNHIAQYPQGYAIWAKIGVVEGIGHFLTDQLGPVNPDNNGNITITGVNAGYGALVQTLGGVNNTLGIAPNFPLSALSNGKVFIAGISGGSWSNLMPGAGIAITNGDGAITITNTGGGGGGGLVTAETDNNPATVAANTLVFAGNGNLIETSGAGDTVTIGQVMDPMISGNVSFTGGGSVTFSGTMQNTSFTEGILVSDAAGHITVSTEPVPEGEANSALYIDSAGTNFMVFASPYILGTTVPMTQIFDSATAPQFVGTTFTANTSGVWSFTMNVPLSFNAVGGPVQLVTVQSTISVTDPVVGANTRDYTSTDVLSGVSATSQSATAVFSAIAMMSATSTVQFKVTVISGSNYQINIAAGNSISWFMVNGIGGNTGQANAALYYLSNSTGASAGYTLSTTNPQPMIALYDTAMVPSFVGDMFTAPATGIWNFTIQVIQQSVFPVAATITINDPITPANSTIANSGQIAASAVANTKYSIALPMSATATAVFKVTNTTQAIFGGAVTAIQGPITFISWYLIGGSEGGGGGGTLNTLTTQDAVIVMPQDGTIDILGGNPNIATTGNAALHQVIVSLAPNIAVTTVTTTGDIDGGADINAANEVYGGNLVESGGVMNALGLITGNNGITITAGVTTLTPVGTGVMYSNAGVVGALANAANGEILTMVAGVPAFAPPAGGGGGTTSFTTQTSGPVLPNAGVLTTTGAPTGFVSTDGSTAHTLRINPGAGSATNGNIFIGGANPVWSRITGINGITISNGNGTIQIDGSGVSPGTGMVLAHTQSGAGGDAAINAGDNSFTFNGDGTFLTATGAGSTVTITQAANPIITGNVSLSTGTLTVFGTTTLSAYGAGVLVTSSTGVISSIQGATANPPGNNMWLMSRPAGTAPLWGTITAADASMTVTQSATGITLKSNGGGGGSGSNAALYIGPRSSLIVSSPSTYTLGTAPQAFTVVYDRAGSPQFVGTTFTANTTGIWHFNVNVVVEASAPTSGRATLQMIVTDTVTPANSKTYSNTTDNSVGTAETLQLSVNALMNATATVKFQIVFSGPVTSFYINPLTSDPTYITWFYISA